MRKTFLETHKVALWKKRLLKTAYIRLENESILKMAKNGHNT